MELDGSDCLDLFLLEVKLLFSAALHFSLKKQMSAVKFEELYLRRKDETNIAKISCTRHYYDRIHDRILPREVTT
jgi:hypothetical protein